MLPDYYSILGVAPDASFESIGSAYRQMALRRHPDRGGSHAKMLEIIEAFEVLSDPESRKSYDFARSHLQDQEAQKNAERRASCAREQAADYPREWVVFEIWLGKITADFTNAEYGRRFGLPTVRRSITGWTFGIGGILAGFILAWLLKCTGVVDHEGIETITKMLGLSGFCLGIILHKAVASKLATRYISADNAEARSKQKDFHRNGMGSQPYATRPTDFLQKREGNEDAEKRLKTVESKANSGCAFLGIGALITGFTFEYYRTGNLDTTWTFICYGLFWFICILMAFSIIGSLCILMDKPGVAYISLFILGSELECLRVEKLDVTWAFFGHAILWAICISVSIWVVLMLFQYLRRKKIGGA